MFPPLLPHVALLSNFFHLYTPFSSSYLFLTFLFPLIFLFSPALLCASNSLTS